MRIARVLTRLNYGGPARQVLASDPRLVARGHCVRVFAGTPEPGEGDLFDALAARGVDVVRVPGLGRGWSVAGDLRARAFLKRALREFEPDVVHTHASKAGSLGRSAARALRRASRVHTFHGHVLEGYFAEPIARGLIAIERRLARDTQRIVAVSHATADDLVRLGVVPEDKIVVVPPGIELDELTALRGRDGRLRRTLGVAEDDFLVGVVGRLAPVKRPEWAVEAFERLALRYPRLQMVFVGDGSERGPLEGRVRGLDPALARRVHLVGLAPAMPAVLADLDAVLLTSHHEGLPVALIEAAAAALPVVAARVGGVPELVAEERTGWLGDTVDELAYGLARLLDDPPAAAAMGQRARLRASAQHSAERLTERLERLYLALRQEAACAS